jgi:CRP-like cAMP-binding protein
LNGIRTMTAVAVEDTVLFSLDKNDFSSLIEPNLRKFLSKRLAIISNFVKLEELLLVDKLATG